MGNLWLDLYANMTALRIRPDPDVLRPQGIRFCSDPLMLRCDRLQLADFRP